jgi:hypothetical protein
MGGRITIKFSHEIIYAEGNQCPKIQLIWTFLERFMAARVFLGQKWPNTGSDINESIKRQPSEQEV